MSNLQEAIHALDLDYKRSVVIRKIDELKDLIKVNQVDEYPLRGIDAKLAGNNFLSVIFKEALGDNCEKDLEDLNYQEMSDTSALPSNDDKILSRIKTIQATLSNLQKSYHSENLIYFNKLKSQIDSLSNAISNNEM